MKNLIKVMSILLIVILSQNILVAGKSFIDCREVCEMDYEMSEMLYIKCSHLCGGYKKNQHDHQPKETTVKPDTTTPVCDFLCSVQLGGHACDCSKPGLPG
ncbi:hypothetical protein SNE40_010086 [Patella caerulea]|uniref:Uncharacterized protein n=1 Tax=Patella caerulea TaxID=87958 RepID=A0AAN8PR75_PATCE